MKYSGGSVKTEGIYIWFCLAFHQAWITEVRVEWGVFHWTDKVCVRMTIVTYLSTQSLKNYLRVSDIWLILYKKNEMLNEHLIQEYVAIASYKIQNCWINLLNSSYQKPVLAVTSKRRRSSRSGLSKMQDLPEQEDKRSRSKSNKKRSS